MSFLLTLERTLTAHRIDQALFRTFPYLLFVIGLSALHSSTPFFYFSLLPSNVATPPSPSPSQRSLSCQLLWFSKMSLTSLPLVVVAARLHSPSLSHFHSPLLLALNVEYLYWTCIYKPRRLASSKAGNHSPPFLCFACFRSRSTA